MLFGTVHILYNILLYNWERFVSKTKREIEGEISLNEKSCVSVICPVWYDETSNFSIIRPQIWFAQVYQWIWFSSTKLHSHHRLNKYINQSMQRQNKSIYYKGHFHTHNYMNHFWEKNNKWTTILVPESKRAISSLKDENNKIVLERAFSQSTWSKHLFWSPNLIIYCHFSVRFNHLLSF